MSTIAARSVLTLLAGWALVASPVQATSVEARAAHDPRQACAAATALVAELAAGQLHGPANTAHRRYYSNGLGEVEADEEPQFIQSLLSSAGKPDRRPMRIHSLLRLGKDTSLYLVMVERQLWQAKRYDTDEMLRPVAVDDPHWESELATWLISFDGNEITSMRQADELLALHGRLGRVRGCPAA